MQFEKVAYTVKEKDGVLHIPIIRTGDLTYKSSVRCFTRTMSAMVMDDFEERRNADVSRVVFLKGEKVLFIFTHSRMHVILIINTQRSFYRPKTKACLLMQQQYSLFSNGLCCILLHFSRKGGALLNLSS